MSDSRRLVTVANLDTNHFVVDNSSRTIKINPAALGAAPSGPGTGGVVAPAGAGTSELQFDISQRRVQWKEGGQVRTFDLTPMLTDVKVTGGRFDGGILTLTQEGGSNIEINLNKMSEVVTADTGNVKFTGNGTTQSPLTASVEIPAYTAAAQSGLKVTGTEFSFDTANMIELKDAFGTETLGFIAKQG